MDPDQQKTELLDQVDFRAKLDDDDDEDLYLWAAWCEFGDDLEAIHAAIEEHKRLKPFFKAILENPAPFDIF